MPDIEYPPTAQAFTRTYNHPSYNDPWDCVEDYRRVIEFNATHPDAGRTYIGRALDLPPSRVRGWINNGIPDPVRGLNTAINNHWITPDRHRFRALNTLVAWIYSSGSITPSTYFPLFVVDDEQDEHTLEQLATHAGITLTESRDTENHRSREVRPKDTPSVFGRVLAALGAPLGNKNPDQDISVPEYLTNLNEDIRREFIHVYVGNRGHRFEDKAMIAFREERPITYLQSLREMIADETGHSVTVSESNIYVSADAARVIDSWPEPLIDL